MRSLTRILPEPQILTDRGTQWLERFIASGKDRPDGSKYGHDDIRRDLNSMSLHKCFYCETKLIGTQKEVDHFIEVSVNKTLAFKWDNLYLSCINCNKKVNAEKIPINQVLDPCKNSDDEIEEHLTFVDEIITSKNDSPIGLQTIRKYRLDTEALDLKRTKQFKLFYKTLAEIRKKLIEDNRKNFTLGEMEAIDHFKKSDQPYSLMFKILISKL